MDFIKFYAVCVFQSYWMQVLIINHSNQLYKCFNERVDKGISRTRLPFQQYVLLISG